MENKSSGAGRTMIVDPHGHSAILFGSDAPDAATRTQVVDGSALATDLDPSQFGLPSNRIPDYFHIIPEVNPAAVIADIGTISVQLINQDVGETFTLTPKQLLVSAGSPLPYRIKKVYKTGTTEDFSIIW